MAQATGTHFLVIHLPDGREYRPLVGDGFFSRPKPRSTPAPGQCVVDLRTLTPLKRWYPLEAQPNAVAAGLLALRQGLPGWFEARWLSGITGTTLLEFLAFAWGQDARNADFLLAKIRGRCQRTWMQWESPFDATAADLDFGANLRDEAIGRERMMHGNEHEDDNLATLLHHRPSLSLRECVLQRVPPPPAQPPLPPQPPPQAGVHDGGYARYRAAINAYVAPTAAARAAAAAHVENDEEARRLAARERFTTSQDAAGVVMDGGTNAATGMPTGLKVSVELKCPYGNRDPRPYDKVPAYYIPQMLAHMSAEGSERCYFSAWTNETTRIWLLPRNDWLFNWIASYVAALLAGDAWTLHDGRLLDEAAEIRAACAAFASTCQQLPGSPFASCFAARDAEGRVLGVGGVGVAAEPAGVVV